MPGKEIELTRPRETGLSEQPSFMVEPFHTYLPGIITPDLITAVNAVVHNEATLYTGNPSSQIITNLDRGTVLMTSTEDNSPVFSVRVTENNPVFHILHMECEYKLPQQPNLKIVFRYYGGGNDMSGSLKLGDATIHQYGDTCSVSFERDTEIDFGQYSDNGKVFVTDKRSEKKSTGESSKTEIDVEDRLDGYRYYSKITSHRASKSSFRVTDTHVQIHIGLADFDPDTSVSSIDHPNTNEAARITIQEDKILVTPTMISGDSDSPTGKDVGYENSDDGVKKKAKHVLKTAGIDLQALKSPGSLRETIIALANQPFGGFPNSRELNSYLISLGDASKALPIKADPHNTAES